MSIPNFGVPGLEFSGLLVLFLVYSISKFRVETDIAEKNLSAMNRKAQFRLKSKFKISVKVIIEGLG